MSRAAAGAGSWLRARGLRSRAGVVEESPGAAAAADREAPHSGVDCSALASHNAAATDPSEGGLLQRHRETGFRDFAARQRFSADLLGAMAVVGLMLTYAVGIEQRQRKAGAAEAAAAGAGEAAPLFFDPPLHQVRGAGLKSRQGT